MTVFNKFNLLQANIFQQLNSVNLLLCSCSFRFHFCIANISSHSNMVTILNLVLVASKKKKKIRVRTDLCELRSEVRALIFLLPWFSIDFRFTAGWVP